MGDPSKLILLEQVLKVIKQENLIENAYKTGQVLKDGLLKLEKEFPNLVNSVRGRGTFLSFNTTNTEVRDKMLLKLRQNGKFQY